MTLGIYTEGTKEKITYHWLKFELSLLEDDKQVKQDYKNGHVNNNQIQRNQDTIT